VTFLISGALLAGAHAFQRIGGLAPCPLCLDQREWHWGVVGASALGFVLLLWKPSLARPVAGALGIVVLCAAGMAAYHVAVEQHWVIAQCDARIDPSEITTMDFNATFDVPRCDEIAWSMFGISMAGYNLIISLATALASFVVAFAPARKAP
jgi:disulfide bond formation protein DsbB